MKDVTVRVPGEVFWIEQIVARHWERAKVYIKAFSSFSRKKIIKRVLGPLLVVRDRRELRSARAQRNAVRIPCSEQTAQ
jgi:hypothetical protein